MTGLLAVAAAATIGSHGISATLPPGWHGRAGHGYLEAATVPLAPERGYIGTSTRARLGPHGVLVVLFENTGAIGQGGVRAGRPRPFRARELRGSAVRNFRVGRRVFSLFVSSGRGGAAGRVAQLNRLVASLRIRAGDFYPGVVRPVRFRASPGWHTGSTPAAPADAVNQVQSWAATVPWADGPYELPPHRTLARLGPHGVAIAVTAWRDDRSPPARVPAGPPFRIALEQCGSFEGVPDRLVCTFHGGRARQYDVDVWVAFGRAHPSDRDRARAQAELDRLRLPAWPRF
jgi:hypothetical protein